MRYHAIVFCLFTCTNLQLFSQITPYRVIQGENTIFNIRFHPDGETIIIADTNGIHFVKIEISEIFKTIPGHGEALDFNSNFTLMVTSSGSGESSLWNCVTGELLYTFEGHTKFQYDQFGRPTGFLGQVLWLDISMNEKYLVTVANDAKAILWNLETKEEINNLRDEIIYDPIRVIKNVGPAVFTPDNTLLASLHKFWTIPAFEKLFEFEEVSLIKNIVFSKSGKYFLSNAGGNINIFDWENRVLLIKKHIHEGSIITFHMSDDEKYLITSGEDRKVHIYDINKQAIVATITEEIVKNGADVYFNLNSFPVQFHPSGKYFALGASNKVLIYDFQEVLASQSQVKEWKDYE